jgi:hypothetical protein
MAWRRIPSPWQEHQVGRFLCVFEQLPARRAHLRTHRQAAAKVKNLGRTRGYRKVRPDFSRIDRVAETALHQRRGGGYGVLHELPDLGIVHERRNTNEKTPRGRSFLRCSFNGVPQEAGDRVAKNRRREERLCGASALCLCVRPQGAQE